LGKKNLYPFNLLKEPERTHVGWHGFANPRSHVFSARKERLAYASTQKHATRIAFLIKTVGEADGVLAMTQERVNSYKTLTGRGTYATAST